MSDDTLTGTLTCLLPDGRDGHGRLKKGKKGEGEEKQSTPAHSVHQENSRERKQPVEDAETKGQLEYISFK